LRFLLEIAALVSIGYGGYQRMDGSLRWLLRQQVVEAARLAG
jgi:hypothetical protein